MAVLGIAYSIVVPMVAAEGNAIPVISGIINAIKFVLI
jgi:hypothetical protein